MARFKNSFLLCLVAAIAVLGTLVPSIIRKPAEPIAQIPTRPEQSASPVSATATTADVSPRVAESTATYPDFRKRPLPVAIDGTNYQWVAANGKDTNVIRQLAHNELEYRRMVEENGRILRRQLVYNQNPAAAVMQRARLTGATVNQLTLPGFDGQELSFVVQRADLEPSQQGGTFSGHLAGRPESLVTLAFQFGREAFTVISPQDNTYLQGHPRESGELIVTSFDPKDYLSLPGGEPIRTTNTLRIAQ